MRAATRRRELRDASLVQVLVALAAIFGLNVAVMQWTLNDQRGLQLGDRFEDLRRRLRSGVRPNVPQLEVSRLSFNNGRLVPRAGGMGVQNPSFRDSSLSDSSLSDSSAIKSGLAPETRTYAVVKVNMAFAEEPEQPSAEEWQDLICQFKAYFLRLIRKKLRMEASTTLLPVRWSYNPLVNDYPISLAVIVNAYLEDGTPLNHENVFQALDGINRTTFVSSYIVETMPALVFPKVTSIQEEVQVQTHNATLNTETTLGDITLQDSDICPEIVVAPEPAPLPERALAPEPAPGQEQRGLEPAPAPEPEGYTAYAVVKLNMELFKGQGRVPHEDEWQDLICQFKAYFLVLMKRTHPHLETYMTLVPSHWSYSPGIDYPVAMSVIVHSFLEDGTVIPPEDVFVALRAINAEEFLSGYIWKTMPAGKSVFYEVARIQEQVQVQSHMTLKEETTIRGVTLQNSDICGDTGIYQLTMYFGFFTRARLPGDQEVHEMVTLTQTWLGQVLQEYYTKRVTIGLALKDWKYEPQANYQIKMKFQLEGRFVYKRGMMVPHETTKVKLLEGANNPDALKKYIKNVVWETPPIGQSAFYYIKRVRMRHRIRRFSFVEPAFAGRYGELVNDNNTPLEVMSEVSGGRSQPGPGGGIGATDSVVIPTFMLDPITVDDATCEQYIKNANGDSNQYLTEDEYIAFVNMMTDNVFDGYPMTALPESISDVFESMASAIPGSTDQAINLLQAFRPAVHTDAEAQILEETREDKLCFYFKDVVNTAIQNGGVETARIDATLNFFLDRRTRPGERDDADREAVDSAFQHVVGTMRPMRGRFGLRALLPDTVNRLLGRRDLAVHVASEEAKLASLDKTECRQDDPNNACFMAQGEVSVFVKGAGSVDAASDIAKNTEEDLLQSVEDGTLNREIQALDDSWSAEPMDPTHTPAPQASRGVDSPLEPDTAPTRMPVFSPPTNPPTKAPDEPEPMISKSTVAAGVGGSVILMVALQCGREFLVDLIIKVFKILCMRFRKVRGYDDSDSEGGFDSDDDSQHNRKGGQGSQGGSRTAYESDDEPLDYNRVSSTDDEEEEEDDSDDDDEEDDEDDTNANAEGRRDITFQPSTSEDITTDEDGEESEEEESETDNGLLAKQSQESQDSEGDVTDSEGPTDDVSIDEEAPKDLLDDGSHGAENDNQGAAGESKVVEPQENSGEQETPKDITVEDGLREVEEVDNAGEGLEETDSKEGAGQSGDTQDEAKEEEEEDADESDDGNKRFLFVPASMQDTTREIPTGFGETIDLDNLTEHVASAEMQNAEVEEVDSDEETQSIMGSESGASLADEAASVDNSIRELENLEQDFVADLDNAMEAFTQASGTRKSAIKSKD